MPVSVSVGTARTQERSSLAAATTAAAPVAGPGASGFHVQIGVFSSPSEAQRAMAAAKTKAGQVLAESSPVAKPITKGDKQLYRARFAGFDSASATNACNELRRNGLDCFVTRAN